jgi:hypothetical protein
MPDIPQLLAAIDGRFAEISAEMSALGAANSAIKAFAGPNITTAIVDDQPKASCSTTTRPPHIRHWSSIHVSNQTKRTGDHVDRLPVLGFIRAGHIAQALDCGMRSGRVAVTS